ncbi:MULTISPECIES: hypothetical protein [unclassified Actinoplanes]|uniref:hypothetical protein n=1 Tax=unclassified Actinoplanes TaxID=2626549 RepID=UPI000694DB81|nr:MULTISPECIES: hypothetical protein [unclassified Actinoplanes]
MSNKRRAAHLLLAGLTATTVWSTGLAAPAHAAGTATTAAAGTVADPTNVATDEDKVKAAAAIGVNPGIDLLVLNDQAFVFALYQRDEAGPYVKAEALRTYLSSDPHAAYDFIVNGIFVAADDDAHAKIVEETAKARRRSVAVTVGLDPSETALIERNDRDFIFAVWQRVTAGSHVWTAAQAAIADGTGQAEWDAFLNTGAAAAAEQDLRDIIVDGDEAQAAKLRAAQLVAAKKSLLQLLLLPVTDELVNAPDRQFVLHIHNNAKGDEVSLASQVALNTPDDKLAQALTDFIFTGGAAANKRDEDAAAAKELAGYKTRVTAIRDAAKTDGWLPNLLAAANQALTTGTLVALQAFLLKGQDEARAKDQKSWGNVALAGDRVGILTNNSVAYVKEGTPAATSWVNEYPGGVKQLVLAGNRIGVLLTNGDAYVKEGGLSTGWVLEQSNVKQLTLAGTRIGVVLTNGIAYVKEGGLSAAWVMEYQGVQQLALTTNRIGVVLTNGIAYVKEGGLSTGWSTQRSGIKDITLTTTRIGLLGTDGTAYVKEGAITGTTWITELTGVKQYVLNGTRIAALTTGGIAWVKEGGVSTAWVNEEDNVAKLALDGDRIAVLFTDGTTALKDGGLSALWTSQKSVGPLS